MFRLICLAALLVGALAQPVDESRVVGGSIVHGRQYPFIVSIRVARVNAHICGGSIINSRWILTAAHCLHGMNEQLSIVAGSNSLINGGVAYPVEKTLYHAQFDPQVFVNDIGLIKVALDIQFTNGVSPIAVDMSNIVPGSPVTVIGWGKTSANSQLSNDLKELTYPTIDLNACAAALPQNPINNGQICAFTAQGSGSCNGDSGGPLVNARSGLLAGLVSFGIPCAVGRPDVYTKVSLYAAWISGVITAN